MVISLVVAHPMVISQNRARPGSGEPCRRIRTRAQLTGRRRQSGESAASRAGSDAAGSLSRVAQLAHDVLIDVPSLDDLIAGEAVEPGAGELDGLPARSRP